MVRSVARAHLLASPGTRIAWRRLSGQRAQEPCWPPWCTPNFTAFQHPIGMEVGGSVHADRQPGIAAQRQGDRPARSLETKDESQSRHAGRRRRQHPGRLDRRAADDLRDRPQQGQHRQRRPHPVRRLVARPVPAGVRGAGSRPDPPDSAGGAWRRCWCTPASGCASPREFLHVYHIGTRAVAGLRDARSSACWRPTC